MAQSSAAYEVASDRSCPILGRETEAGVLAGVWLRLIAFGSLIGAGFAPSGGPQVARADAAQSTV